MKAYLAGWVAVAIIASSSTLVAAQDVVPHAATTQKGNDLGGLVGQLRSKLNDIRDGSDQEIPLGQLAKELDQARQDIERLAELVLRKEISEIRQQSDYAIAVQEIESLGQSLAGAESRVANLQLERDRMEAFVTESALRVDELADQLIAADDARLELEISLKGSREEAEQARADLTAASERIASIDAEIDKVIAQYDERAKLYETELADASQEVAALASELQIQEAAFENELAIKDSDIAVLTERQAKAREALVQALAEFDTATANEVTSYEREMLRSAEASSHARAEVLNDLGFERDERGQLVPPRIEFSALERQPTSDLAGIEPALGNLKTASDDYACGDRLVKTDRPYLDNETEGDWQHYLVGTLRFAEAATHLDAKNLTDIANCLTDLSEQPSTYFKLIGHTDAKGAASYNQRLSLSRAQAVRDVFGQFVDIASWRLFAQGRGERFPISDNETEAGRELNRRVEVFAVKAAF